MDSYKQKEFVNDNFEFAENGRKFSKQVENTVGKGEIARYEQFLLFPQCFQKTCTTDTYKTGLVWEKWRNYERKFIITLTYLVPNERQTFLLSSDQANRFAIPDH